MGIGRVYFNDDLTKELKNFHNAATLNRGKELPEILRVVAGTYSRAGFADKSRYYLQQALNLDGDSIQFLGGCSNIAFNEGNWEHQIELEKKILEMDSTRIFGFFYMGYCYSFLGESDQALVMMEEYLKRREGYIDAEGNNTHRIAYIYWINGDKDKANYYFDKQLEYCKGDLELGRSWGRLLYPYYDLAGIYAFREKKEQAFSCLSSFSKKEKHPIWMVNLIKSDPLFNSIRDEPDFQQIIRDIETKYQAEHERVRQWLEENDML
jgi:tetratricopeptide (TPR) repeat protein